ncbi:MAG: 50S ribosomal protein L29 [Candidatus Omnitrophica bacterium]|nr:50S ribosomal protein L29 [Candidatus Omnitrophota bacterium]MBU1128438.1 50S ribosomal protein L29 [Candidatus Omnitrophota bacterium]MBU1784428.1 50S ribosomal protein L29 [Candidatus Omnitrophota bacterium]MBU1851631.1 50S ribosomal protein L29 [Candidatus Omnitrophota bacterium]
MKPSEIRNMTEQEIEQSIITLKEKLFTLRAETSTGRIERPQHMRDAKRDIARCYTILKEKTSGK